MENIPVTEAKWDATQLSNAPCMCIEDDLDHMERKLCSTLNELVYNLMPAFILKIQCFILLPCKVRCPVCWLFIVMCEPKYHTWNDTEQLIKWIWLKCRIESHGEKPKFCPEGVGRLLLCLFKCMKNVQFTYVCCWSLLLFGLETCHKNIIFHWKYHCNRI
jgi:hypothetical protein